MSPFLLYAIGIAGVISSFIVVWLFQLKSHNSNLVDAVWSWGLGALGIWFACTGDAPSTLRVLLAALSGAWSLRLGIHVYTRNHGKPEDPRYAKFRMQWGDQANRNLFWFYQFQTVFSALLALPFVFIAWRDGLPPPWAIAVAVAVWIVSVAGEATADAQLASFKAKPGNRGRVNRSGLWRYSRHPNYFFECLHWCSYLFLLVGTAWWWIGLIAPAVMAFLLLRLSGIPITEEYMARERPEYAEYMRTTSPFIPWPPKQNP